MRHLWVSLLLLISATAFADNPDYTLMNQSYSYLANLLTDAQLRASPLSCSVTNFPASQPVTGSFYQATQPVSLASVPTHGVTGTFWQATQPVSGTFYQATQPVSIASMPSTPVTGTFWQATQPVSGPLTDAQLRASAVPVSGTFYQATQPVSLASAPTTPVTGTFWQATQPVSGTFWQATQPVSGTFWQATQPVSGPVTDAQLRASAVPVSLASVPTHGVTGTFWQATQPVSIASMPSTPVTGTFWQATQPVSGTFWQATQPVSIASMPSTPVTGTFFQATQPVSLASVPSHAVTISGSNPCQYAGATLLSATGATSGTAAVQIVALSGSLKIYLCSLNVVGVSGTTPTFSLVQGTGSNCATGQTVLVQSWTTAAGTLYPFASPVAVGAAGNALCYLDTGTTPIQRYTLTYVQQ